METIETFNMPEEIRSICGKRRIQFKELAKLSGQTGQNLYNKMNRTDWKLTEMKRVLDVLDADLCLQIVDRKTGKPFSESVAIEEPADTHELETLNAALNGYMKTLREQSENLPEIGQIREALDNEIKNCESLQKRFNLQEN